MDWFNNPKSENVPDSYMREGCRSVLDVIKSVDPVLVIPMDKKTFDVLKDAMIKEGFEIESVTTQRFLVLISDKKRSRYHRELYAFKARLRDEGKCVVVKSPQHPAKILESSYGRRCGAAIREAAIQIAANRPVNVEKT
jgi:hypothetical protein